MPLMSVVQWFGEPWEAPLTAICPRAAVPVGAACEQCEDPIVGIDQGFILSSGRIVHRLCFERLFGTGVTT